MAEGATEVTIPKWMVDEAFVPSDRKEFFGIDQAAERAISLWGRNARVWNRIDKPPSERCQIGVGGAGYGHIIYGIGATWLDAAREAGLLDGGAAIMKASEQLAEDLREFKRLWLTGEFKFPALVERAMELPCQREQAVYYALLKSHAESTDWREKITKRLDVAIENAEAQHR